MSARAALRLVSDGDLERLSPRRRGVLDGELVDRVEGAPADLSPIPGQPYAVARIGSWYGSTTIVARLTADTADPAWWSARHPGRDGVLEVSAGGWATPAADAVVVRRWDGGDLVDRGVVLDLPPVVLVEGPGGPVAAHLVGAGAGVPLYRPTAAGPQRGGAP